MKKLYLMLVIIIFAFACKKDKTNQVLNTPVEDKSFRSNIAGDWLVTRATTQYYSHDTPRYNMDWPIGIGRTTNYVDTMFKPWTSTDTSYIRFNEDGSFYHYRSDGSRASNMLEFILSIKGSWTITNDSMMVLSTPVENNPSDDKPRNWKCHYDHSAGILQLIYDTNETQAPDLYTKMHTKVMLQK